MIRVTAFERLPKFEKQLRRVEPDVREAAEAALQLLLANPNANSLRCHRLHGYRPTIFKIDVFPNRSWQITFELNGTTAILRKIAPHSELDRSP